MRTHNFILSVILFLAGLHQCFAYNMAAGTVSAAALSGNFYDSQGSGSNYLSNENITETFTNTGTSCLQFVFTSFQTQVGNDILTIYDGPTTAFPVIGQYSGTLSPGTITSSSGSLTFTFVSNALNNKAGWAATITSVSCASGYSMTNGTISTCSSLFYDPQGTSNYTTINSTIVETFTSNSGNCLSATFYTFSLSTGGGGGGDVLSVYDGTTMTAPLIGSYTSTTLPPPMLSSSGSLTFKFVTNGSGFSTGWTVALSCDVCPSAPASSATYLAPTAGLDSTHVGTNMVSTCGGTFTDDGNTLGNYSNNIPLIYRTFCPTTAGNCLRVNFSSFSIATGDALYIGAGPTQDNAQAGYPGFIGGWNGACSSYQLCMGAGLGPFTSFDQSGCLTFMFGSSLSGNSSGWVATFDCVPCASGPNGTDNSDCSNSTPICSNSSFSDASTGPGIVSNAGSGCALAENYSNWYKITIYQSGTLGLIINPINNSCASGDDYDFSLYLASSCSSLGTPVRCSYAAKPTSGPGCDGQTGLSSANNLTINSGPQICGGNNSGSDVSETVCGNQWTNDLTVTAGQTYYLLVNKWTPGGSGFNLSWVLTNGASLDCSIVLPVTVTSFTCAPEKGLITLDWKSQSEFNNDHYVIEKSSDGENFILLVTVPGKGTTSLPSEYFAVDNHPYSGNNYYRLTQVDKDGSEERIETISCTYQDQNDEVTLQVFDLSGRLLYTSKVKAADYELAMHNLSLSNGVYITAVIHSNGTAELSKYLKMF